MDPIRARYAGTCARTGQPYNAGDLIVKMANGKWARAQDKAGNIKVARPLPPRRPDPVWQYLKLPDGKIKRVNIRSDMYCGEAAKQAGMLEAARATEQKANADMTPYAAFLYVQEGVEWVCRVGDSEWRMRLATKSEIAIAFPEEEKRCWECGGLFTYAQCQRNGGDWNENGGYCGC